MKKINKIVFSLIVTGLGLNMLHGKVRLADLDKKNKIQCEKMNTLVSRYAKELHNNSQQIIKVDGYVFIKVNILDQVILPYRRNDKIILTFSMTDNKSSNGFLYLIRYKNKDLGASQIFQVWDNKVNYHNNLLLFNVVDYFGNNLSYNDKKGTTNQMEIKYRNNLKKSGIHNVVSDYAVFFNNDKITLQYLNLKYCFINKNTFKN
jgi:hypothetical protein